MIYTVKDRFLKYVQVDTQADPYSETVPSTVKQKDLTALLVAELEEMNIPYKINDAGYIYAYLDANVPGVNKKVFFCAHIDTAPDCSGTDVKPIVHSNYDGKDLILPDDETQVISTTKYPALLNKMGHDIISASGKTLLGADDKAGVAIIFDAFWQMVNNPDLPHGPVRMLITTDEEIGKGIAKVDLDLLDADFGFTLDGGELGSLEDENFSADAASIYITGVATHPAYGKGVMQNASKIAGDILSALPKDRLSPETTEDKEGFIHPTKVTGSLESAQIDFILRDFETEKLKEHAATLEAVANAVIKNYPQSSFKLETRKQYRNMKDVLDQHPYVIEIAKRAMENLGIESLVHSIRGGTDGAGLSHMGKPCPNLFAGQQAIHSKHEWVSVQDMQKAVDTVVEICKLTAYHKSW
ncbi:MAG: peptidase T [Saprospiraceae bacterium]|nr:peptidase T [Saprospiraceae bacterium]